MSSKDYYKILGVSKSATKDEIKKAYRTLALKYHPDRNSSNKESEEKFKELSEAYAVLSDPEKKKQYDTFGADGFQQRFSQEDIFSNFNFSDIFKEFGFGDFGGGWKRGGGSRVFTQSFSKANKAPGYNTGGGFSFNSLFGDPAGHTGGLKGQDAVMELPVQLEDVFNGTQKTISYNLHGINQQIKVKIPPGITDGKKLRVSGKGQPGRDGGPPGDLYIKIKILDHPVFKREGDDLYVNKEVPFSGVLLGTQIGVTTIDEKSLNLKIPAGTQSGSKMRLKGNGMPHMGAKGRGDQYVRIQVAVPKKLNKSQKEAIEKLKDLNL